MRHARNGVVFAGQESATASRMLPGGRPRGRASPSWTRAAAGEGALSVSFRISVPPPRDGRRSADDTASKSTRASHGIDQARRCRVREKVVQFMRSERSMTRHGDRLLDGHEAARRMRRSVRCATNASTDCLTPAATRTRLRRGCAGRRPARAPSPVRRAGASGSDGRDSGTGGDAIRTCGRSASSPCRSALASRTAKTPSMRMYGGYRRPGPRAPGRLREGDVPRVVPTEAMTAPADGKVTRRPGDRARCPARGRDPRRSRAVRRHPPDPHEGGVGEVDRDAQGLDAADRGPVRRLAQIHSSSVSPPVEDAPRALEGLAIGEAANGPPARRRLVRVTSWSASRTRRRRGCRWASGS